MFLKNLNMGSQMQSDKALTVNFLSKEYYLYSSPLSQILSLIFGGLFVKANKHLVFESLSFETRKGETLGIIGRNGVGKSTLLQIISGIVKPTTGSITINGKVAALLELGAGFNAEYTGLENIFLVCAIYGMSKTETQSKVSSIIDFAEIGDYIHRPVKTYSSGMFVRLAFSIIANINADVLIVDEALAVGDIQFQQKCNRFFKKFKQTGGTIIFVSHDVTLVKTICDRVLYLYKEDGVSKFEFGNADQICNKYFSDYYKEEEIRIKKSCNNKSIEFNQAKSYGKVLENSTHVFFSNFNRACLIEGEGGLVVNEVTMLDSEQFIKNNFNIYDLLNLRVSIQVQKVITELSLAMVFKDRTGQYLISEGTSELVEDGPISIGINQNVIFDFNFRLPYLIEGNYTVDLHFTDGSKLDHSLICVLRDVITLSVSKGRNVVGLVGLNDFDFKVSLD